MLKVLEFDFLKYHFEKRSFLWRSAWIIER